MLLKGRVSSIQSMGTLDGPGVRFVVFMQGCNLSCGCCHNPETHSTDGGTEYTAQELVDKAERFKAYFGNEGGITLSGGEPLLQSNFVLEVFSECKARGINTCLDTSGSIINDGVLKLLRVTDRVLLDIKYHTEELYKKHVGCSINAPLRFLSVLNDLGVPTTLRQVIVPSLNDNDENINFIKNLVSKNSCIDNVELLPFKKICKSKYESLGKDFPFDAFDTPSCEIMQKLQSKL